MVQPCMMRAIVAGLALGMPILTGCGSTRFEATDGTHYGVSYHNAPDANTAAINAAIASAVHDIPCERASITIVTGGPYDYILQGCGQRVTYSTSYVEGGGDFVHFVLSGRFSAP